MRRFLKFFTALCLSMTTAGLLMAQNKPMNLVAGTFAEDGLQVYEFNPGTGDVQLRNKLKTGGAIFITTSADNKRLYTVTQENNEGFVYAFAFDSKTAELKFLNKVSSKGSSPSYITLDEKGMFAFVPHYMSGNVCVFPIQQDGTLGEAIQVIQHEGSSVNLPRQDRPRAHSAVFTPDHQYLMVGDLGTDKIMMYKFDAANKTAPLAPASTPFFTEKPGGGTRLVVVHPNKKFVYSIQELTADVTVYAYKDGMLSLIETVPMMEEVAAPGTLRMAADIQVSPDGKFLYASNRGEANELVVYAIDAKTGKLELRGKQSSLGRAPRYFAIDPAGNYVVVSNMGTLSGGGRRGTPPAGVPGQPVVAPAGPPSPPALSTIIVFKRDKSTGLLTDTGRKIDIVQPGFLMFIPE